MLTKRKRISLFCPVSVPGGPARASKIAWRMSLQPMRRTLQRIKIELRFSSSDGAFNSPSLVAKPYLANNETAKYVVSRSELECAVSIAKLALEVRQLSPLTLLGNAGPDQTSGVATPCHSTLTQAS